MNRIGCAMRALVVSAFLLCSTNGAAAGEASLRPDNLRCEYRADPLGIDVARPRLSWLPLAADENARGLKQSAYQVLAASDRQKLDANEGDLWDSGKVASDETCQVVYQGKVLFSGQQCFWKVRLWDANGAANDWSAPAMFSAGLLEPSDWKAKWIGYDAPAAPHPDHHGPSDSALTLDGCQWVWSTPGDSQAARPPGKAYFRKVIELPADASITAAKFLLTVDDSFELSINGRVAGRGGDFRRLHRLDVSSFLQPGKNVFTIVATNGIGPAGLIGRLRIDLPQPHPPIVAEIDRSWKVSNKPAENWQSPEFDDSAWPGAYEIGAVGVQPWGKPGERKYDLPPPPYLRKEFALSKPIRRAMIYASAQGLYELSLNGQRIGEDYFRPGWTDYRDRIYYQAYDVTGLVKTGANAIGGILGDGWFSGYYSFQGKRRLYDGEPRMIAQLAVEFEDGTTQTIATDETWKAAYGPIIEADLLMGCAYDARRAMPGWDQPGFDDSGWQPVAVSQPPAARLQAAVGDPVRKQEEIAAKAITEPSPGVYVFDLGQNMVGWVRLKVNVPAGTRVKIRHAEMLNPDGTLYTVALRSARATDFYYANGTGGDEVWEPKFTFHGFRYVELSGLPEKPGLDAVTGMVVHADMPRTGEFECSNPLVNQLFHNIIWGQKGNYLEVPTDCPQRDERLGWTGDAQFFIRTGTYNFDVSAFFTKWIIDLVDDAQHPDGSFADVAPDILGGHGNTAWGDAGIICPYTIYRVYGDTRIIERHYDHMARYVEYLKNTSKDFIRGQGAYGDWLNLGGGAKPEVIGTAYFAYVARLMSEMAAAIDRTEDAQKFADWSEKAKQAFQEQFIDPDGRIKDSSQTGYALAFTMGLIPDAVRDKAARHFVEEIEKKDWHLATGFIGTPRLLPALTDAGRSDVAYRLLLTDTFPSWLYPVTLGATTMWERWDGWTPEKGFQDPGMNSFNHYAFGSVGQWMCGTVAGIDTDGPGFRRITIHPVPGKGLRHARASYDSIRGTIASSWKWADGKLSLDVTVPPNTTATVYVPSKDVNAITESGKPATESTGVQLLRQEKGAGVYKVGSGRYTFASPF